MIYDRHPKMTYSSLRAAEKKGRPKSVRGVDYLMEAWLTMCMARGKLLDVNPFNPRHVLYTDNPNWPEWCHVGALAAEASRHSPQRIHKSFVGGYMMRVYPWMGRKGEIVETPSEKGSVVLTSNLVFYHVGQLMR